MTAAKQQAEIFTAYLLKSSPTQQHTELYEKALASQSLPQVSQRTTTLQAGLDNPQLLAYLDAHDAFFRPNSELRQRLYLIFSILEASPDFTDYFLPIKRSKWYIGVVPFIGLRAIWRLLVGFIIVKSRRLQ